MGRPPSRANFLVSHVNGAPSFVRKYRKSWLAQGSSVRRVALASTRKKLCLYKRVLKQLCAPSFGLNVSRPPMILTIGRSNYVLLLLNHSSKFEGEK